ncbi:MAG: hypothetical protein ACPG8W_11230 [Candidatus Promineifilaceae bacterium]
MRRRNLLHLLEAFYRHPWRHITPLILLAICGAVYSAVSAPLYTSRGVLYVRNDSVLGTLTTARSSSYIYVTRAQIAVDELETLLVTDSFLRAIIQRTDLEDEFSDGYPLDELLVIANNSIFVQIVSRQQVAIEAQADTPELAYQLALATMETYRQYKINVVVTDSDVARGVLSEILTDHQATLDDAEQALRDYLTDNPEPLLGVQRPETERNEITLLRADMERADKKLLQVESLTETIRLSRMQAEREIDQTYVLVDSPRFPSTAAVSLLQQVVVFLMFCIVGLILSIVFTVGTAVLDTSFRFPLSVKLGLELPVLGTIARGEQLAPSEAFALEKAYDPHVEPAPLRRKLTPETDPPTLIIPPDVLAAMSDGSYSADRQPTPHRRPNPRARTNSRASDPMNQFDYWNSGDKNGA